MIRAAETLCTRGCVPIFGVASLSIRFRTFFATYWRSSASSCCIILSKSFIAIEEVLGAWSFMRSLIISTAFNLNSGRSVIILLISRSVKGSTSPDSLSTVPRKIANFSSFSTCKYVHEEKDRMLSFKIAP